ncbi:glycosyltransferase family 4 protein [Clostridium perfringens]|nr:glycosyltransferase family 4 protein [Clostridium perfringens]EIF6169239.1 glycosyltransferase family 4 protein [Clostridium perfringens]
MKITVVTGPFSCLPPYSIGAVEKLWNSVGVYLIEKGIDVTFISKKVNGIECDDNHKYIKGYERTGSWLMDFFKDFIYSFRALKQLPKSDIVILNSLWSPLLARFFKHKFKISIFSVERFPKRQLNIYSKIGKIDYFRCCSSAVYNELILQSPQLKNNAWVIPNFIDTKVFNCNKKRNLVSKPTIVYAGRVHKEKGIHLLVKAIQLLQQREQISLNLMIIGARDKERGGSGEEYINYLKEIGEGVNFNWIDPIYEPQKLADEICKGDIFCYPSIAEKGETFGVAPLEAMGLGIPTIVSALDCFKDFVTNEVNALVFNHNDKNAIEELAYKIKYLINSQEIFNKLSVEGAKTAKNFSIEEISKVYYSKFKELLDV